MADLRIQGELLGMGQALEKAAGVQSEETFIDIVRALGKYEMSLDLLRATKIGLAVDTAKKSFDRDSKAFHVAKDLVSNWKTLQPPKGSGVKTPTTPSPSTPSPSTPKAVERPAPLSTTTVDQPSSPSLDDDSAGSPRAKLVDKEMKDFYDRLDPSRKGVVDKFTSIYREKCDADLAHYIGITIEMALYGLFEGDKKEYGNRFRLLSANIKRNPALQEYMISKGGNPNDLVRYTPEELATEQQRSAREADVENSRMSRRADFYALKRADIQKSVGVDSAASAGNFRCRKCKKENTSFYQMQTRSSDEPMTVFINCLECGFRWRE